MPPSGPRLAVAGAGPGSSTGRGAWIWTWPLRGATQIPGRSGVPRTAGRGGHGRQLRFQGSDPVDEGLVLGFGLGDRSATVEQAKSTGFTQGRSLVSGGSVMPFFASSLTEPRRIQESPQVQAEQVVKVLAPGLGRRRCPAAEGGLEVVEFGLGEGADVDVLAGAAAVELRGVGVAGAGVLRAASEVMRRTAT